MNKNKVKEFVKNHKKEIALAGIAAIVGGTCGYGIHANSNTSKHMEEVCKKLSPVICGSEGVRMYLPEAGAVLTVGDTVEAMEKLIDITGPDVELTGIGVFLKETSKNLG